MVGKAELDIPISGGIGPTHVYGLSDEVAMSIGRVAAYTLSECDGYAIVTLSDGETKVIGYDSVRHRITIGRLTMER